MFRVWCCIQGNSSSIRKIAIAQFVLYAVLISLSIFGSIYYKDELPHEGEDPDIFTDRLYMLLGILHAFPLALAIILYIGIVTEKYYYLRSYIFIKIFETIINTIIFLSVCVLYAFDVDLYFAILLCVAPLSIGVWSLESVVIVNAYYNETMKLLRISQKLAEVHTDNDKYLQGVVSNTNELTKTSSKATVATISTKNELPNSTY